MNKNSSNCKDENANFQKTPSLIKKNGSKMGSSKFSFFPSRIFTSKLELFWGRDYCAIPFWGSQNTLFKTTLSFFIGSREFASACHARLPLKKGSKRALLNKMFCGERGIRTPGGVTLNGFQDHRIRPLCHLSGKLLIFFKIIASASIQSTCHLFRNGGKNTFFFKPSNMPKQINPYYVIERRKESYKYNKT